jgi:hypothetical protein
MEDDEGDGIAVCLAGGGSGLDWKMTENGAYIYTTDMIVAILGRVIEPIVFKATRYRFRRVIARRLVGTLSAPRESHLWTWPCASA